MSVDVLISGRLCGEPSLRLGKNGHPYLAFCIAATDKSGGTLLCGCIALAGNVIEAVEVLGDGDTIAVAGEAAGSTWHGLDVTVHSATTLSAKQLMAMAQAEAKNVQFLTP